MREGSVPVERDERTSRRILVFDIETNGIDFERGTEIDQAHTIWCVCTYDLTTKEEISYGSSLDNGNLRSFDKLRDVLLDDSVSLVGHNAIAFDIPILEERLGIQIARHRVIDTLVLSRLLYPDRPGGHSLEEWGTRFNYPKGEHSEFDRYSDELVEYCRQDVRLTAQVYQSLAKEAESWGPSVDLEHKIADIMARQQRVGMQFDCEEALRLEREFKSKIHAIDEFVQSTYPPRAEPIRVFNTIYKINGDYRLDVQRYAANYGMSLESISGCFSGIQFLKLDLNSPLQQKELLELFGWKPTNFTPTGQPQLDDSIAEVPVIGASLHERNVLNDRLKKVSGLLDMVEPATGRIHGGANPCGTPTGRMRHKRIVNIPKVSVPYGRELRALFIARPGYVLVGYDAASLELRILAHYIGSEKYILLVISTDKDNDAHTLARDAAEAKDRDTGKTINYAMIYGARDDKLGSIVGKGKAAGRLIRERLYYLIPNFKKFIDRVSKAAKKGYIKGLDGRRLWLRSEYKALNTLIQGGGAIFMKTVAKYLDTLAKPLQEQGLAFKVLDMHDEGQWEVAEQSVEQFKPLINQAFQLATEELKLRCPQAAEIKVGKNWMETH